MRNAFFLPVILIAIAGCAVKEPGSSSSQQVGNDTVLAKVPEADYYAKDHIRYSNHSYQASIKTVLLHNTKDPLSQPLLRLNSSDALELSFDDLDAVYKNFSYTFIHCNADWQPSGLWETEYLEGFSDNFITSYKFSFNTRAKYIHYSAEFPNSNIKFTKTGNYIVLVYLDGDKENIILTRRFMVFEERVEVKAQVKRGTLIEDRNYKQEVDFVINHAGYNTPNPFVDFKVVLLQNFRWDNAIYGLKPLFIKDQELVYDYGEENVFPGGKEYRNFDIRNLQYKSEFVRHIEIDSIAHVHLQIAEPRSSRRYFNQEDINGKYLVKTYQGSDDDTEADYAMVHFYLKMDNPLPGGQLYVFGALSDWDFKDNFRLRYDPGAYVYTTSVLLKQGYYNYNFVFLEDGKQAGDVMAVEGTSFEAENDYTVLVYHRPIGRNYDELIGVKTVSSTNAF